MTHAVLHGCVVAGLMSVEFVSHGSVVAYVEPSDPTQESVRVCVPGPHEAEQTFQNAAACHVYDTHGTTGALHGIVVPGRVRESQLAPVGSVTLLAAVPFEPTQATACNLVPDAFIEPYGKHVTEQAPQPLEIHTYVSGLTLNFTAERKTTVSSFPSLTSVTEMFSVFFWFGTRVPTAVSFCVYPGYPQKCCRCGFGT